MQRDQKPAPPATHIERDWRKVFARSGQELMAWQAACPDGENLLRWCLLNGKISEAEYLEWASETFQIPVILPNFFTEPAQQSAGRAVWEKTRASYPWTPGFFPVAEWQGVLHVACIEPRPPAALSAPHCLVLASARRLNELWTTLQSTKATATPSPLATTGTAAPMTDASTDAASDVPEGLGQWAHTLGAETDEPSLESQPLESPSSEAEPQGDGLGDLPEGLSSQSLNLNLNFSSLFESAPQGLSSEAPLQEPAPTKASPEALVLSQLTQPAKAAKDEELEDKDEDTAPFSPMNGGEEEHADDHIPTAEELKAFNKDRTEITRTFDIAALSMLAEQKINPIPAPVDVVEEVTNSGEKPLAACATYDEIAVQALYTITKTFEHSMVLLFQSGQLRPWKWSDKLQSRNPGRPSPIDLSRPSIFRIAYRTCLPYHGYVVSSPENEAFFGEWYGGQLPKHATLMPMLINNQLIGMILGITEGQVGQKSSLRQMEDLAQDIAANFKRLRENKKSAQAAA